MLIIPSFDGLSLIAFYFVGLVLIPDVCILRKKFHCGSKFGLSPLRSFFMAKGFMPSQKVRLINI